MDILSNIGEKYKELSETEKLVVDFALKYKNKEELKIKNIEDALYISSSTIIRACKKLGYSSFSKFKFSLINIRENENENKVNDFKKVKETIKSDFLKTLGILNEETIDKIVESIKNSKRIFCIGLCMSSQFSTEFNRQLKLLGFWSNDYIEKYAIERIPEIAGPDDLIIVFSLSGEDSEINNILINSKMNGVKIACICSLGNNTLGNISDIVLSVYNTVLRKRVRSRLMLHLAATMIIEKLVLMIK